MVKNPNLRKRELNVDARKLNIIVTLTGIGASLILAGFTYMNYDVYQTKYNNAQTEIAQLEGQLSDLKGASDKTTVNEIKQNLYSATSLGQQVTELQNTFNKPLTAEDDKAFQESEGESVDALNTTRYSRLKLMFSDKASGSAGSSNWYPRLDTMKSSNASWKFITTTSFTTIKQNVMWQCVTESGEIYAYVTAIYDADKEVFDNVEVVVTTAGAEAQTTPKGA